MPLDKLREQLEINVIGQVAVTQAFMPMIRAAKGRVIFISSIGGRISVPFNSPYGASKHAIEAIGDALRQEVAQFGVDVAIIEPGAVATPIWDKGQAGAPALREAMDPDVLALYADDLDALEAVAARSRPRPACRPSASPTPSSTRSASSKPRTRYLIGREAKVAARMRRILPDRVFDRIIARQFRG